MKIKKGQRAPLKVLISRPSKKLYHLRKTDEKRAKEIVFNSIKFKNKKSD